MFSPETIARATPWEIQGMLESIEKELEQLRLRKMQLEFAQKDLKIELCRKSNGGHKYELIGKDHRQADVYMCECGAVKPGKS